jgi:hypothetical protein
MRLGYKKLPGTATQAYYEITKVKSFMTLGPVVIIGKASYFVSDASGKVSWSVYP